MNRRTWRDCLIREWAKRLVDIVLASVALTVLSPVLAAAALSIRLSSPGPILYRARRVGRNGKTFTMYKFRTMSVHQPPGASAITAPHDPRVFPTGAWLRRRKIDELPQLINILRGEMSIVGPRPEDVRIVSDHYAPLHLETLQVPPGLTSPGSIYYYSSGERLIAGGDPEALYISRLLPIKLALEIVYIREASLAYDLAIIFRTILVILLVALGKSEFPDPPEMERARPFICPVRGEWETA